jgi:cytochrome P450
MLFNWELASSYHIRNIRTNFRKSFRTSDPGYQIDDSKQRLKATIYDDQIEQTNRKSKKSLEIYEGIDFAPERYDDPGHHPDFDGDDEQWQGVNGIDWQLERARRVLEGPTFAPFRMTMWAPNVDEETSKPGFMDSAKILFFNALQILGLAESMDGAPLVNIVNKFKGSPVQLLSRIADGNLAELAGGPLFLLLRDYYKQYGSVFKLAFGPKSFIVVSDPVMAKHILKENPLKYDKGILAEILEPIMGKGLIPADPETWKVRRKAIVPGFHKAWLNAMMSLFVDCNKPLIKNLEKCADAGTTLDMETQFCSVSLDIIGRAVFNFNFRSVETESPVVKAVYRALQEAEYRSTSFVPYWNLPFAKNYMKNLQEFESNMELLNSVLNDLIKNALETQQVEDLEELEKRDYSNLENPSLLRFLVDMRGENTTSTQLRDDLMTMLIAGHETTAAMLTWTFYELSQKPELYRKVREEVDTVLRGREPEFADMANLPLLRMCLAESLRMYPEPPVLIRRALDDDVLPKGGAEKETYIAKGTDVFIATWNIHRSPEYWENPDEYDPERFTRPFSNPNRPDWQGYKPGGNAQTYPNEVHSDYAFMPFGGGSRKCVGDQFAMMEATATLALIIQKFDLKLAIAAEDVGMKTGATIHTENGLIMSVKRRTDAPVYDTRKRAETYVQEVFKMPVGPLNQDGVTRKEPAVSGCPMHQAGLAQPEAQPEGELVGSRSAMSNQPSSGMSSSSGSSGCPMSSGLVQGVSNISPDKEEFDGRQQK